jgi:hypothetical protein
MRLASPTDNSSEFLAIEYYPSPLAEIPADKLLSQNIQDKIGIVRTKSTK